MHKLLGLILLLLPWVAFSQEAKKENPVSFYGFVRSEFYLDSYKGLNAFQDIFYLYPNYIGTDALGKDINDQMSANFVSVVTRGGVNIIGPDIFGAKTTGCIEVDFAGKPEIFLVRLRKAFTLFSWKNSKLLVGQTWHPFFSGDAFPKMAALSTGTPMQPFNRSPQVRFDYKLGSLSLYGSALYQQQYTSLGPIGGSNMYKRDAVIPETAFGFEYAKKAVTLGAGVDFNRIKPRVSTIGTENKPYVTDECLNSTSWVAYGKYAKGKLMMLLKGYYGGNMSHLTMIGGYGVSGYNTLTGHETYTNLSSYSTLFNITYGTKWRPGLFVGYLESLGSKDALVPNKDGKADVWGWGTNIKDMFRVSPSISYSVPKFLLQAEYEMTKANYGVGKFNFEDGLYADKHAAINHGVRLVMTYYY